VNDLVVIVLDRPRHEKLIEDIRRAGARIRLISDGDLFAGVTAAVRRTNVHAVIGIGGAPEGVLTAAVLRCLNGGMRARLVPTRPGQEERMRAMGITDPNRIYTERDLAPGPGSTARTRWWSSRPSFPADPRDSSARTPR